MDLFEHRRLRDTAAQAPLADRMRPRTLDEFVGQDHIVGPGRLLRRAIEADQLSSLIFYGPPGTGKTTLARIIANTTDAHFIAINAVLAGVKDIREAVAVAGERRGMHGQRTILFVDEVHRFNKAQQDALLPWVENGTVVLIGATTENPYFEVNKALVSRSRVFQLRPLEPAHLRQAALAAIADAERGYGGRKVDLHEDALAHLIDVSGGDARAVLNALELAVETTVPGEDGTIVVDLAVAEESIQRRAVLYDKEGDAHFDTISAFIKSLRGSDPDAALYWLARMVYAGEDPRFIFRRMLILASEDVGLADPAAIGVVTACARAFDYVGLPEGQFHLAQAALYLATAPKSNSALAYFDALESVGKERVDDVPAHLKDANRDREGFGHGEGYRYPHAYRDHWVAQQYLPAALQGRVFYQPSDQGREGALRLEVLRRREAQLAAMLDAEAPAGGEVLTFTGALAARDRDRWLARVSGRAAERLAALRDRVLDAARVGRSDRVLVLGARSGLLTWEAVRRAPEGGVWALTPEPAVAEALTAASRERSDVERPVAIVGALPELPGLLALRGEAGVFFDAIVGYGAPIGPPFEDAFWAVCQRAAPGARISLALSYPAGSSRPSSLLAATAAKEEVQDAIRAAEGDAYGDGNGEGLPDLAWRIEDVTAAAAEAGLEGVAVEIVAEEGAIALTAALLERWLGPNGRYRAALARRLGAAELAAALDAFAALPRGGPVPWSSATLYLSASVPAATACRGRDDVVASA